MNLPLTPRQTFTLYGVVVAGLFVGYIGVLAAGQRGWVAGQDPGSGVTRAQSLNAEDDEAAVDFYQELDQAKAETSTTRPAPTRAKSPLTHRNDAGTDAGHMFVVSAEPLRAFRMLAVRSPVSASRTSDSACLPCWPSNRRPGPGHRGRT